MQKSYKNLATYYDLFFQQKDYQIEVDFILEAINKYSINSESILDIGCGTGSHLNLIKDKFTTIFGIDLNDEILNIAKKKVPEGCFVNSGMIDFSIQSKFDVITCLYAVFNYNKNIKSGIETLKNIHTHLNTNGICLISLYNEKTLEKKISLHMGKNETTKAVKLNQYKYDPSLKTVKSDHLILIKENGTLDFDIELEDEFRIFDFKEIETMVQESGFTNHSIYANFSFEMATQDTKYPVLVLIK